MDSSIPAESFETARETVYGRDNVQRMAACLEGLVGLATARGRLARAATLHGAAEALREATRTPRPPPDARDYARILADLQAQLDPADYRAAHAIGRALAWEQAVVVALERE